MLLEPITVLEDMPAWLDEHHAELNEFARACYQARDDSDEQASADDYHAIGDIYLERALALTAEFSE